ncbi:MAG: c-type cytochrome [Candidatus Loosdrechtia sp.]|uniref:c-type cytochrome n=1 Tax=Candidatus Loosdrechtia sp. TaxID=3101272 RepID=UPI003A6A1C83|nr:MAG: c-type cytochrome [Candidatus Jettenia sp. AMX2]
MKKRSFILILLPTFYLTSLPNTHLSFQQQSDVPGTSDASDLFEKNCAKCHGKDGRAKGFRGRLTGARNLTDVNWQTMVTDEQIATAIKRGPGAMPGFGEKFSQVEIDSLVAYVRGLK